MSQRVDFKEASRKNWHITNETGNLTIKQINCGALLRIADASEAMAKSHTELIRQRDEFERWYKNQSQECARLRHQVAALKGVITRMKKARVAS